MNQEEADEEGELESLKGKHINFGLPQEVVQPNTSPFKKSVEGESPSKGLSDMKNLDLNPKEVSNYEKAKLQRRINAKVKPQY